MYEVVIQPPHNSDNPHALVASINNNNTKPELDQIIK